MNILNLKKLVLIASAIIVAFNMVNAIPDVNLGPSVGGCDKPNQTFGPYQCHNDQGQVTDVVCRPDHGTAKSCDGVTDLCSSGH